MCLSERSEPQNTHLPGDVVAHREHGAVRSDVVDAGNAGVGEKIEDTSVRLGGIRERERMARPEGGDSLGRFLTADAYDTLALETAGTIERIEDRELALTIATPRSEEDDDGTTAVALGTIVSGAVVQHDGERRDGVAGLYDFGIIFAKASRNKNAHEHHQKREKSLRYSTAGVC